MNTITKEEAEALISFWCQQADRLRQAKATQSELDAVSVRVEQLKQITGPRSHVGNANIIRKTP